MNTNFRLFIISSLLAWTSAQAQNIDNGGLRIGVAADLLGEFGLEGTGRDRRNIQPREAEFSFFAPIDYKYDGVFSAAAHNEAGEKFFELHEMYIASSKSIPRVRWKLGQYFLGVGRLNRFHRHDWALIQAPTVHETFFAEESAIDTGGEFSWLLPTPFYLDWTFGLTSGWTYGHSHTAGERPRIPTHYTRLATFLEPFEVGLNYLGRLSRDSRRFNLFGLDLTGKIRNGQTLTWLFQSETWYRLRDEAGVEYKEWGTYGLIEHGWNPRWSTGLAGEYFTVRDSGTADAVIVPQITYRSSEFARFRLAYRHELAIVKGQENTLTPVIQLQATFIIGAHPAHDF